MVWREKRGRRSITWPICRDDRWRRKPGNCCCTANTELHGPASRHRRVGRDGLSFSFTTQRHLNLLCCEFRYSADDDVLLNALLLRRKKTRAESQKKSTIKNNYFL